MDIQLKKRFEKMRDSLYTSIDAYSAKGIESGICELFRLPETMENIDMSAYYMAAEKVIDLFFNYLDKDGAGRSQKVDFSQMPTLL